MKCTTVCLGLTVAFLLSILPSNANKDAVTRSSQNVKAEHVPTPETFLNAFFAEDRSPPVDGSIPMLDTRLSRVISPSELVEGNIVFKHRLVKGTISPRDGDTPVFLVAHTARVQSNLETKREIIALGLAIAGILGVSWGGALLSNGIHYRKARKRGVMKLLLSGTFIALAGLAMSGFGYLLLTGDLSCHLIE